MTERYAYKYTAKGEYPPDWYVDLLDRFWEVTDCKHVTATFVPRGIPVASIREVQSRFVSLVHANQTTAYFYAILVEGGRDPREGDLIFSRNATVGAVAQVASWHPKFAMGQDVCLLRRKVDGFAPGFLQALIQSPVIGRQLDELMVGSTFKRVNVQQIRAFIIPMPSAVEQRAIAAALSDADALLDAIDRVIAKKRAIKQATMQQLLTGRTRLPGFSGEWAVKRLGELGLFVKGQGVRKDQARSGEVPCIRYGEIYTVHNDIVRRFNSFVSRDVAATATPLRPGDILFAGSGETKAEIGKSVAFTGTGEAVAGGDIVILRQSGQDAHFLGYYLNTDAIAAQKSGYGQGDAVVHIGAGSLAKIEVRLPPLPEQRAIAAALLDMDAELEALQQRRHKTERLKQGMMQELLTGRTRLV